MNYNISEYQCLASPSKVKYPSINPLKRGALYASVGAPNSPIGVISALPTIIAITANNIELAPYQYDPLISKKDLKQKVTAKKISVKITSGYD